MRKIKIYDTTLRDGSQTEGVSFSVNDKMKIAEKLDHLGVHYIEGGWPGSNPKDKDFFTLAAERKWRHAVIAAFGSTRRAGIRASEDVNLKALVKSQAPTLTIFGKSWDLHVTEVLKTSLEENLRMIEESVAYLKKKGREVFYDAEHFFDGYKADPRYALETLLAAREGGADGLILCDTNGGSLPGEIRRIMGEVVEKIEGPFGIHTHNDMDLAVANSLAAVEAGAVQIQGTFNGLGERCGNADLGTLIAVLHTKMGRSSIPDRNVKFLTEVSRFISEVANMTLPDNHPFVGRSAFAHKGGVHIDAVLKHPRAYEHIEPERVGNRRRFVTSELAGKMPIVMKAAQLDVPLDKKSPQARKLLEELQLREFHGYQYEAAEASFELFMKRGLKKHTPFFTLEGFKVATEKRFDDRIFAEASVRITVDGSEEFSAAEGHGPVDALDKALRRVLVKFYPDLEAMHLVDYKVRVLDPREGTAAKVRVLIESRDEKDSWTTIGVDENIIQASWEALCDSVEYKLMKDRKR